MVKCVEIVDVNELSPLLIGNVDESHRLRWELRRGGSWREGMDWHTIIRPFYTLCTSTMCFQSEGR